VKNESEKATSTPDSMASTAVDNFDWRTEEAEEETLWEPEVVAAPSAPRRRRPAVLAALALLVLAAVMGYRQLAQRVDEADTAVKGEVLDVFDLMWQAAERGDAELYGSLSQAASPALSRDHRQAVGGGRLFDRSAFGLARLGDGPRVVSLTLSPDQATADLRWQQDFARDLGLGLTETVTLEYEAAFRLEDGRWLHIEPGIDYWGRWQTFNGRALTVNYPARDAGLAERLAADLDELVQSFCAAHSAALGCPDQRPLRLRLDFLPRTLQVMHDVQQRFPYFANTLTGPASLFELPAPTLVGLPLDEAAYQALYRGYARHLLIVMAQQAYLRSSSLTQLDWVRLEQRAAATGLRPWPPAAATPPPAPGYRLALTCATPTGGDLYEYDLATAVWQRRLADLPFTAVAALPDRSGLILQTQAAPEPAVEAPARPALQLQSDVSGPLLTSGPLVLDQTRAAQTANEAAEPEVNWWLYRDGEMQWLHRWQPAFPGAYASVSVSDDATRLLFTLQEDELTGHLSHYMAELELCLAGNCRLQPLPGRPLWSPDGRYALLTGRYEHAGRGSQLYLADGAGRVIAELGTGQSPFWIDDESYGFIHTPATQGGASLRLGTVRSGVEPVALSFVELLAQHTDIKLAEDEQIFALYVTGRPAGRREVLLSAHSFRPIAQTPDEQRYTLRLAFAGSGLELENISMIDRGDRGHAEYHFPAPANGRWLTRIFRDPNSGRWAIHFTALEEDQQWQFELEPGYAIHNFWLHPLWSPDGRWLLLEHDGAYYLLNPETREHHVIVPETLGCAWPAWLE
jgi:hypothetical protein